MDHRLLDLRFLPKPIDHERTAAVLTYGFRVLADRLPNAPPWATPLTLYSRTRGKGTVNALADVNLSLRVLVQRGVAVVRSNGNEEFRVDLDLRKAHDDVGRRIIRQILDARSIAWESRASFGLGRRVADVLLSDIDGANMTRGLNLQPGRVLRKLAESRNRRVRGARREVV